MIAAVAALTGALAVFVAFGSLTGQFSFTSRKLAARALTLQRGTPGTKPTGKHGLLLLKEDALSSPGAINGLLKRLRWGSARAQLLDRADLPLKVSEYVLIVVAVFAGLTLLVTLVSRLLPIGLLFGLGGVIAMDVWVKGRARRRLALFNKQLPVALQVMATSLKSGFGIMESVQTVSRELDEPLSGEFRRIIDQSRVGGSFEAGLTTMVERIQSKDLRIVARALEVHRKVGGDLASILESVASTMREREELRGHILALTAQQRMGGMIVGLLPLWVVGFFSVVNPEFISPLWQESTGRILLAAGACMEIVAFFAMRKIMTIEV